MKNELVIDAAEGNLGRVASYAAKQALLGKKVKIVNCNDALITGDKKNILASYKTKRARGGSSMKGPNFPRSPERIMKRTVRGMLSFRLRRGREALEKIICYNKNQEEFYGSEKISLKRK